MKRTLLEFVAVVDAAFQSVLENPDACPAWRPDRPYRKLLLKRFPYVAFFGIDAATSKSLQWRTRSDALVIGWIVCVRTLSRVIKKRPAEAGL